MIVLGASITVLMILSVGIVRHARTCPHDRRQSGSDAYTAALRTTITVIEAVASLLWTVLIFGLSIRSDRAEHIPSPRVRRWPHADAAPTTPKHA